MLGSRISSNSGCVIKPLSLTAGPTTSTHPASSSARSDVTTSCSVPTGKPRECSCTNSTSRSRRPVAATSARPSRNASSRALPPSPCGKSWKQPMRIAAAPGMSASEASGVLDDLLDLVVGEVAGEGWHRSLPTLHECDLVGFVREVLGHLAGELRSEATLCVRAMARRAVRGEQLRADRASAVAASAGDTSPRPTVERERDQYRYDGRDCK